MTQNSSQLGHHHDKRTGRVNIGVIEFETFGRMIYTSGAHDLRWYL